MNRLIALCVTIGLAGTALLNAQDDLPPLTLPPISGAIAPAANAAATAPVTDPVKLYDSPAQAALAAFQAAYKAATAPEPRRERAIHLFLLSLQRDPKLAKALYNLAVLCALDSRWQDAISFQKEFQMQSGADPALVQTSNAELKRVQLLDTLSKDAKGQQTRRFDVQLAAALKIADPLMGLDQARRLALVDSARWEAPALTGVFEAAVKAFGESAKALNQAAASAPAERRANIRQAADEAAREASFIDQISTAYALWEKQQFEEAAQKYEAAWGAIPARFEPGFRAASGYLMVDRVDSAVAVLSRMQESAPPETGSKVIAMLTALAVVSEKAQAALLQRPTPSGPAAVVETASRIRTLVGDLSNAEVELVIRPDPKLIADNTSLIGMPDDQINGGQSNLAILSSSSIFAMYKVDQAAAQKRLEATAQAAAAAAAAAAALASNQSSAAPARVDSQPVAPAPAAANPPALVPAGPPQSVRITSTPPGAGVQVDGGLKCVTPCEFRLTPGRHTLSGTLAGQRDASRILTVESKPMTVNVEMEAKMGSVRIDSATPGSAIYVNGKKTDKVTPVTISLPEGDYEIGVESNGAMKTGVVSIKDSGFTTLSI